MPAGKMLIAHGPNQTGGYHYFGEIPAIPSYPWYGSAITVWDSGPIRADAQGHPCALGTAAPLLINVPAYGGCPADKPQDQWGGQDPHDRRRYALELTAQGRARLPDIKAAMAQVETELRGILGEDGMRDLRDLLVKLRADSGPAE